MIHAEELISLFEQDGEQQMEILQRVMRSIHPPQTLDKLLLPFLKKWLHDGKEEDTITSATAKRNRMGNVSPGTLRLIQCLLRKWRVSHLGMGTIDLQDHLHQQQMIDNILRDHTSGVLQITCNAVDIPREDAYQHYFRRPLVNPAIKGFLRRIDDQETSFNGIGTEKKETLFYNVQSRNLEITHNDIMTIHNDGYENPKTADLMTQEDEAGIHGEKNLNRGSKRKYSEEIDESLHEPTTHKISSRRQAVIKIGESFIEEASAISKSLKGLASRWNTGGSTKSSTSQLNLLKNVSKGLRKLLSNASSALLGECKCISIDYMDDKVVEEIYSSCFLIGRLYVIMEIHKLPMEILGTVTDIALINQGDSSSSTATMDDMDVALYCTGVLLPVLRSLSSPVSRIFVKIVDNLMKSHPAVVINCLIVPGVIPCAIPVLRQQEQTEISFDETVVTDLYRSKTYQLEFLQRIFRQTKDLDIVNHLLVLVLDPLDQISRNYFLGLCNPLLVCMRITSIADAYITSWIIQQKMSSSTAIKFKGNYDSARLIEDLWMCGKDFSLWFLLQDGKNDYKRVPLVELSESEGNNLGDTFLDRILLLMRGEGLDVDSKDSLKSLGSIISSISSLHQATVESVIIKVGKIMIDSKDAVRCACVGTIMYNLVSKHFSKLAGFKRETRSILEKYAPHTMIAKSALSLIDKSTSST